MELTAIILGWYAAGALGSYLVFNFWWRQNINYPLDIELGDIILGSFTALLGPINLVVGIAFFASWVFSGTVNTNRVIFQARRR